MFRVCADLGVALEVLNSKPCLAPKPEPEGLKSSTPKTWKPLGLAQEGLLDPNGMHQVGWGFRVQGCGLGV